MKDYRYITIVLATSALLSSCSTDDTVISQSAKEVPLELTCSTADLDEVSSRAIVTTSTLAQNSVIGVTACASNSTTSLYKSAYVDLPYYVSGSTSSSALAAGSSSSDASSATKIMLSSTAADIYAYYPYSNSYSTLDKLKAISISAGLTSSVTDYMYATKVASVYDHAASQSLTMNHALCRVTVKVKIGTYTGTGSVTALTMSGNGIATSGTLNIFDGSISATKASYSPTASGTATTSGVQVADVLIVPVGKSGTAGTVTLTLTIDGKSYSVTTTSQTLASGKYFTFTLTINDKELTLSAVNVTTWGTTTDVSATLSPS